MNKAMARIVAQLADAAAWRELGRCAALLSMLILWVSCAFGHLVLMVCVWNTYAGDFESEVLVSISAILGLMGLFLSAHILHYVAEKLS